MRTIALFGGSFNPVHPGHFETAFYMRQALGVDEVWLLFYMNAFKDALLYAPLHLRIAMGELMAKHYPGKPFIMSDIEESIGSHRTFDVIRGIREISQ
jgi:nicotinate-nucleotide adenylyltransferase